MVVERKVYIADLLFHSKRRVSNANKRNVLQQNETAERHDSRGQTGGGGGRGDDGDDDAECENSNRVYWIHVEQWEVKGRCSNHCIEMISDGFNQSNGSLEFGERWPFKKQATQIDCQSNGKNMSVR